MKEYLKILEIEELANLEGKLSHELENNNSKESPKLLNKYYECRDALFIKRITEAIEYGDLNDQINIYNETGETYKNVDVEYISKELDKLHTGLLYHIEMTQKTVISGTINIK